jgi:hypothetical protein
VRKVDDKTLAVQRALWHHIREYSRKRHLGETTDTTFNVSRALVAIRDALPPESYPTKNSSSTQRMIARMLASGLVIDKNEGGRGKDLRVVMTKMEEVEAWPKR